MLNDKDSVLICCGHLKDLIYDSPIVEQEEQVKLLIKVSELKDQIEDTKWCI